MKLFPLYEAILTPDIHNSGVYSFGFQQWPRINSVSAFNDEAYQDKSDTQLINAAIDIVYKIIKPGVDLGHVINLVQDKIRNGELDNKQKIEGFVRNWKKDKVSEREQIQ